MKSLRLTQTQIRRLSIEVRPKEDAEGNVVLVDNTDRKPYRFSDGNKGAPIGFRIYVGPRKVFYEIRVKKNGVSRYIALPGVKEIDLADAHSLANEKRKFIVETGKDPKQELLKRAQIQEGEKKTLGDVLDQYLADIDDRVKRGKYKASSRKTTEDNLLRFDRAKDSLRNVRILDLTDALIKAEFYRIRNDAMQRSKLLPVRVKNILLARGAWWHLTKEELVELGLTGRMIELAKSAGLVAAERAMMVARTAVDQLIESDRERAARDRTQPIFYINPFAFLAKKEFFRTKQEMQKHYENAEVRNPLSQDAGSIQGFMKALILRRDWRDDRNVAPDYLFLTLLWGCRRGESSVLRWWDSLSKDEIQQDMASWVWLTDDETRVNPKTKCKGSQVFFHNTKNGQYLHMPVGPFAKTILLWRRADRERFHLETTRLLEHTKDPKRIEAYQKLIAFNQRWVFPARKGQSEIGRYTVSNAIFHNLRVDAGLYDPEQDIDIGLSAHDLRRTLGRFAGRILPGHIVSQLLNHRIDDGAERMSIMSERYSQQEWPTLREAMERVEASMISTSPRVWNALRTPDMPEMDDQNDPPLQIRLYNRKHGYDTEAQSSGRQSFAQRVAGGEQAEG